MTLLAGLGLLYNDFQLLLRYSFHSNTASVEDIVIAKVIKLYGNHCQTSS